MNSPIKISVGFEWNEEMVPKGTKCTSCQTDIEIAWKRYMFVDFEPTDTNVHICESCYNKHLDNDKTRVL